LGLLDREFSNAATVTRPRGRDPYLGVHYIREPLATPPRVPNPNKRPLQPDPSNAVQPAGPSQPSGGGGSKRVDNAGAAARAASSKFNKSAKVRTGGSLVGLGQVSALYKRVPRLSRLEKRLENMGLAVPHWAVYNSVSRATVKPDSGSCSWFGVPDRLDHGWHYANNVSGADKFMITPGNCDLYDIFIHQIARHVNADVLGMAQDGINMSNQWQHFMEFIDQNTNEMPSYRMSTQTSAAYAEQLPSRTLDVVRGMDVKQYVTTKLENVSNLEAFVDTYELTYDPALEKRGAGSFYSVAENATHHNWFGGGSQYRVATTDPGYGSDFACHLMEEFAMFCVVQRGAQLGQTTTLGLLQPLEHAQIGPARVDGSEYARQLFCHPRNNPLDALPKGIKNVSGFRLRKLPGRIGLLPAQCATVSHTQFMKWNYFSSPRGMDRTKGGTSTANTVGRPVAKCAIRFYRVHGDMIQSFAEDMMVDTNRYTNNDFQTGSPTVMFQTERTVMCRLFSKINARLVPFVVPFDAPVDDVHQFHIDRDGNFDHVNDTPHDVSRVLVVNANTNPVPVDTTP